MPVLPATSRQVAAVWKLLGVMAYGVGVEAAFVVRTASKLIQAVMADTSVETPFDSMAHADICLTKYQQMANAGSMGQGATRALTQAEREAKPEYLAKQARIAKRWEEKTEGVVRIKKCYHDASHSDVPTVSPNVPNRFKMRELSPDVAIGPRCFYCNHVIKNRTIVWARLASMHSPMSPRPFRPLPPSAVCPDCVPVLNEEIAKREHKAVEQGRRAANIIVYGYDGG
jgi:hypothetical protein